LVVAGGEIQSAAEGSAALNRLLPVMAGGFDVQAEYRPQLATLGRAHPVTRVFSGQQATWGKWRQVAVPSAVNGDVLLEADGNRPLLVLRRLAGEDVSEGGRVAQLTTDLVWLWQRGYDGGGPYQELLRRVTHWLMREAALDEQEMDVRLRKGGATLAVEKFITTGEAGELTVTTPAQTTHALVWKRDGHLLSASHPAHAGGAYHFSDGTTNAFFVKDGRFHNELRDLVPSRVKPDILAKRSQGLVLIRGDQKKLPFADSRQYQVKSSSVAPFAPEWVWAAGIMGLTVLVFRRESK
jgi:hypothetical protein